MKRYVVGLVFDNNMEHVLMLKRIKPPFLNLYNGVGGKIEQGESPKEAMLRELEEETGLVHSDLSKTQYIVTLSLPNGIELKVFYFILKKDITSTFIVNETNEGILEWLSIQKDRLADSSNPQMAGDGNIAYFVQLALIQENRNKK